MIAIHTDIDRAYLAVSAKARESGNEFRLVHPSAGAQAWATSYWSVNDFVIDQYKEIGVPEFDCNLPDAKKSAVDGRGAKAKKRGARTQQGLPNDA